MFHKNRQATEISKQKKNKSLLIIQTAYHGNHDTSATISTNSLNI